jgi:branched-chain amino acid transport system substrate-binding protein
MQMMIEALVQAIEKAGNSEPQAVALQLEKSEVSMAGQTGRMRASDHQFQQALVVGMMAKQGDKGVNFDVEGSGYGFRVIRQLTAEQATRPNTCNMVRPG